MGNVSLKHLKKVSGHSFEDICQMAKHEGIEYHVREEPNSSSEYFRDSTILLAQEPFLSLGFAKVVYREGSRFTYAFYEIEPGFDFQKFDGRVRFDHGRLVERVRVDDLGG